jgi:hypothetical protein
VVNSIMPNTLLFCSSTDHQFYAHWHNNMVYPCAASLAACLVVCCIVVCQVCWPARDHAHLVTGCHAETPSVLSIGNFRKAVDDATVDMTEAGEVLGRTDFVLSLQGSDVT